MDDQQDNPYRSFGEIDSPVEDDVFDDATLPRAPKIIGVLNLVFGALLCLCGLCQGFYLVVGAVSMPQFQAEMQKQTDAMSDKIETLKEELETAEDADTEELQRQIDEATEQVEIFQSMPNPIESMGLNNQGMLAFFGAECVITVLLNLFLFISGIGLLGYSEWGRRMGVWVAGLKVVNLIVVAAVMVLVVAPTMASGMGDFLNEVAEQQNEDMAMAPGDEVAEGISLGVMIWAVVWTGVAALYPAICLWQLNRSQVKRACQAPSADFSGI